MAGIGYLLIAAGFLVGALAAVQTDANEVSLAYFLPGLLVGVVGVVLARLGSHRAARNEESLNTNFGNLTQSIDNIVTKITRLDAEKDGLDPYDAHGRIDDEFRDDLTTFADARESIAHLHGLAAYADIMNDFAAGERYINRVWSASIDGWVDEVREHIGRAREQFVTAQEKLRALQSAT